MMSDGTTADPVESVVAATEGSSVVADDKATGLLDAQNLVDVDPAEPVDDGEEIEYDGEKFKVPKKLKDGFLMQADYTRKTQAVAESQKALEAREAEYKAQIEARNAAFEQQEKFLHEHIKDVAKVESIDERLAEYAKLDWDAITAADPVHAIKLERQVRELQTARQAAVQKITAAQQQQNFERQQLTAKQQQEMSQRQEAGRRELEASIKGYATPEVQEGLKAAAVAIGYKPEELAQVNDPRAVKLLHKAYLYDQLVAKATKKPAAEPLKPVTRIAAKTSPATVDEDKMTAKEWATWRNEQLAQRNKKR